MPTDSRPPAPTPLPGPIVDNHAHLDWGGMEDPASVTTLLAEAQAAGVTRVVQVGCELDSAHWTAQAVLEHPQLVGAVALHPNEAPLHAAGTHDSGVSYEDAFAQIADLARAERIRAVGETGLDYFRTGEDGRAAQETAFRDHIALAKEVGLPLQIHDRDAHADVLRVLDADGAPPATVLHCFSGDEAFARECVERGFYLSFAGTATFRNAPHLLAAAVATPASHVLIETDAPFLTPHPHRGLRNAPAMAAVTARAVAHARGDDLTAFCAAVNAASGTLYGPW